MVGSPFCLADLQEISWRDLQWVEMQQQEGLVPVQEEVMEDVVTGEISTVVIPDRPEINGEDMEDSASSEDH